MSMKKILQMTVILVGIIMLTGIPVKTMSQGVTTSAIEGTVLTMLNDPVPNANVVAVHEPSGTRYGTVTTNDGRFNIPNVRTGGPYTVTVTHVGLEPDEVTNLRLSLGETRNLLFILINEGEVLQEVVITGRQDPVMNSSRTGAATNVNSETIKQMPTISRTIEDYTRLSPLSNQSSFAGRDNRFNNYTVDGNIYNSNFGLGGQFAGTNPISMEAIEEIQINIAPFDVRQGGFTGANVNAITKSGSNQLLGSIYYYYRNEQLMGQKIGDNRFTVDDALTSIRGASISGPILRDKLFFFFSIEQEESSITGDSRLASRPGLPPDGQTVSRVPADRMDFVREQMMSIYGYETGDYENYPFANEALRLNFRLDYNINRNNRASLRYNRYEAFRDVQLSPNSTRNVTRYGNTNRDGIEALTFRNANYSVDNNVNSFVGEISSVFGTKYANNLNIGYTFVEDPKRSIPNNQVFPFIEVLEWDGAKPGDVDEFGDPMPLGTPLYYFTLGNELYSVGNLLQNKIFNVTNNFSIFAGMHTLTAGLNFEYMTFANAFNPNANTFYRFNSYDSFVAAVIDRDPTVTPDGFAMSYSYAGPDDLPLDETAFGQFGIYLQDKIEITRDFVVTAGLRIDVPFFPIDLPNNPRLDSIFANHPEQRFTDPNDSTKTIAPDVSQLPGYKPLYSPRLSFNYDVLGDNSLRVRGGSGLFSGRIPFVWISNQVSANGVTRGLTGWDKWRYIEDDGGDYWQENTWGTNGRPDWQGFQEDPSFYKPDGANLQAQISRDINITDPEFRFPQVWRTNLAIDYRLPFEVIATLEGIYTKDYNSPLAQNINLAEPTGTFSGVDQRPYYSTYTENSNFNEVIMLRNTDKGYYWSVTAQLQKEFDHGIFASFAYSRGVSKDFGLIGGSQAGSLWPNVVAENRNDPELGFSRFDQPNRIVSYLTFNTQAFSPNNSTTFSVFYIGGEAGRFSYTYSGNFGDRAQRLMYIPNNEGEINLLPIVIDGDVAYTPEEQWEILNAYIEQDPYLSQNRGQIAERNGALLPWLHRFDLRIAQDIMLTKLPNRHKIQITFDILNFGNMINSEWGVSDNVWQASLLNYAGRNVDTNEPQYRLNTISGTTGMPTETYKQTIHIDQTWRAQIGIRYIF